MDKFDIFVKELESELKNRYEQCEDFAATPSNILLTILNAVAFARQASEQPDKLKCRKV